MRRVPILATLIVAAAASLMVWLGIWQLGRAKEKDALRERYERNMALPPVALPPVGEVDESLHYRRAIGHCLQVVEWRETGGSSASGRGGTRFIALCRADAAGHRFAADMGVSVDPRSVPAWSGGDVVGRVTSEPSRAGLLDRILRRAPSSGPMIVSERAAPGLEASAQPTGEIVNNSLSYAFQWFFFAATGLVIYGLALRRRNRAALPPEP
jgi:surfeit locus 1 family protein